MPADFTLSAYRRILDAARSSGYRTMAVADWFDAGAAIADPALVLRHDVDRRPKNALAMAEMEAEMGVRASYYFRMVPVSFVPAIVARIAALGHEIGYHYEDWDRAKGDPDRAMALFAEALAKLRAIAPVRTMCMHGSPLARESNMTLWKHRSFEAHGVRDCILSHSWTGFAYFTDAGRTFGTTSANLRDELGEAVCPDGVRSSADLAAFFRSRRTPRVMVSTHPERWSDAPTVWARQWAFDAAANVAKRGLRALRAGRS
jgi:hypothetical protein